jgi:hypothetical protein
MFSTLYYEGRQYPARIAMIPGHGEKVVSILTLQKELINEGGSPVDEEAESVDNSVFFYVDDYDIMLGDRELANLVMEGITYGHKHLKTYLRLPRKVLRKWNDRLWSSGHLDFDDLGIVPNVDVARWSVTFEDGFSADIRVKSGKRNTLHSQGVLFDPEGKRVFCTKSDTINDLDGEWILWNGDDSYHIHVMEGDEDEQKKA